MSPPPTRTFCTSALAAKDKPKTKVKAQMIVSIRFDIIFLLLPFRGLAPPLETEQCLFFSFFLFTPFRNPDADIYLRLFLMGRIYVFPKQASFFFPGSFQDFLSILHPASSSNLKRLLSFSSPPSCPRFKVTGDGVTPSDLLF